MKRGPALLLSLAALLGLAACNGQEGTIGIQIISDPSSDVLTRIDRLRATLGSPDKVVEVERDGDGPLTLNLDLKADGHVSDLFLEGFNAAGARVAVGRSGPLPINAIDIDISVFMAEPLSLSNSPAVLDPPRSSPGVASLSFGTVLAGGLNRGAPVSDLDIYSLYLHTVTAGQDMPAPLVAPTVMAGNAGFVYLLGGTDAAGEPVSTSLAFDTRAAPAGNYSPLALADEYARGGASAAIGGSELFVVSGDPALVLDGFVGSVRPLRNGESMDGEAVTVFGSTSVQVLVAGADVGDGGAALYDLGNLRRLSGPDSLLRREHRGVTLPSGQALFLGGTIDDVAVASAVLYSPDSASFSTIDLLATPRRNPAVAVTPDYLVVAGGEDDSGEPVDTVEIYHADTLDRALVAELAVPRKDAVASALANGQVLIAGGIDTDGNPVATLELFTPDQ